MFTLDWSHENRTMLDTNFSETPEHKCGHVFKMDNGNFFIYPNNRVIWMDNAWTFNRIDKNPGYKIDMNAALACYKAGQFQAALEFLEKCEKDYGGSFDKLERVRKNVLEAQKKTV